MGQLDVHIRHGGGGGGDLAKIVAIGAGVLVLTGGGGLAAATAGITAALTDLLYWVAGTIGLTVAAAGVLWAATRRRRMERQVATAELRADLERAYRAEVLARQQERAAIQARAQAQAWAPLVTAIAAAVQQQPGAVPVLRGEVER